MSIATLAMYDLPEMRSHIDRFWSCLAEHMKETDLTDVPSGLDRSVSEQDAWRRQDLLFSQSCGYPVLTKFADDLRLVASPVYAVEGCEGATYRSALIVHKNQKAEALSELRGAVAAINNWDSQSGFNTFRASLVGIADADVPFFSTAIASGGHRLSIAAVADGKADIAAIDNVTLALVARYAPQEVANIRILDWTGTAPSLPFVARKSTSDETVAKLQTALKTTFEDPKCREARDGMLLSGIEVLSLADYAPITDMIQSAETAKIVFSAQGMPG